MSPTLEESQDSENTNCHLERGSSLMSTETQNTKLDTYGRYFYSGATKIKCASKSTYRRKLTETPGMTWH